MMIFIGLLMSLILLILPVLFVIAGEWFIYAVPTVQVFRERRKAWGKLNVNTKGNCSVAQLGEKRFEEVSAATNPSDEVQQIRDKRFAKIVAVVSYKDRELRILAREMRMYSGLFLILLMVGISTSLDGFENKSLLDTAKSILSYHVVPLLEAAMIVYLSVRLAVAIQSISLLLEGED